MKDLSIILLDNSARERFHTLDWLNQQTVPRDRYELIWVECHDEVKEVVRQKVDKVICLHQKGLYHKHKAENAGIIAAEGRVITMCDSDAVYPPEFVASVIGPFEHSRLVLMHYEERCMQPYPDGADLGQIMAKPFGVWPNVGACLSMLRRDAIGFGGVDEHDCYQGHICGPNELTWRMMNSGVPEVWIDRPHIYHFQHPGSDGDDIAQKERGPTQQDIDMHNRTAVEGFASGRLLPLVENAEIHGLRMTQRVIGTDLEMRYAWYKDLRAGR